jgi:hypothetical protein
MQLLFKTQIIWTNIVQNFIIIYMTELHIGQKWINKFDLLEIHSKGFRERDIGR